MLRVKVFLLVSFVLVSLACSVLTQPLVETPTPVPIQNPATLTAPPLDMSTAVPVAMDTPTQAPADTSPPIAATATTDSASATMIAEMGSMGRLLNLPQYFKPVGTPLESWRDVPIMPQATDGQEFNSNIYSYIAAATLDQGRVFYQSKASALGLVSAAITGYSGSGSLATHNVAFSSYALTIMLTSYDNDTAHVIVVISKVP